MNMTFGEDDVSSFLYTNMVQWWLPSRVYHIDTLATSCPSCSVCRSCKGLEGTGLIDTGSQLVLELDKSGSTWLVRDETVDLRLVRDPST